MWKNPLCGKILFMKSNLPSFVWKKSPLWKNPFYKVQFTFLCVEKSLVWKSPFYKVQFSFLGKSFFIKSSLPSLVSTGDRRAATQESPSVLEQRSVFFFSFGADQFFSSIFLSGISKVETNCFGQHSPSNPRCRRSAAVQRPLWPTTWQVEQVNDGQTGETPEYKAITLQFKLSISIPLILGSQLHLVSQSNKKIYYIWTCQLL